jgi:hypothetical protein
MAEAALVVFELRDSSSPTFALPSSRWIEMVLVALASAALWLLLGRRRRLGRSRRAPFAPRRSSVLAVTVPAMVGLAIVGYAIDRSYLRRRYTTPNGYAAFLQPLYTWAGSVSHTSIALWGTTRQYPLYGRLDSNRVVYLGRPRPDHGFAPPTGCLSWRRAVDAARAKFLAITAVDSSSPGSPVDFGTLIAVEWTQHDPHARVVLRAAPGVVVFRLDGALDERRCG